MIGKKSSFFHFYSYLNIISPPYMYLISTNTFWDVTKQIEPFNLDKNIIFWIFERAEHSLSSSNYLDSANCPTNVPEICDIKMDPRCNVMVSVSFLFVSGFRNICYLSQKKVSSLRNTSFPYDEENSSVKFMDFLIWINVYWTNIQKKTTKGAYNNENSKFVVFNNWSSWRSSQNSDHLFQKLFLRLKVCDSKT